ncbi:hypothetical protein OSB04_022788 [Centaurea solstitialis]|uniref:RING-type E3 ubiquitin transferase n=1 Tax=Centaurea solstitialis TaxID=347529 RepID=A0AA38WC98_9ASTR|nr:hypothetical protein OSB04_022788 [Centaurea solstitialis]
MVSLTRRLLLSDNPSSGDNTDDGSPRTEETDFDANMVLVLAALLCALVVALVLNSVIHVFLRRRRESLEAASTNVKSSGLEKRALRKIPVAVFRLRTAGSATECSICLGDFIDGEKVRVLPECNHEFHVKCVDKWLAEHTSCPNCRRSLVGANGGDRATVRVEHGGGAAVV